MKKLAALLLCLTLCIALWGCGTSAGSSSASAPGTAAVAVEGTAEEVLEKIYAAHAPIELPLMSGTLNLTDGASLEYNAGLPSAEGVRDAALSEPMMGQAYSLVVVRAESAEAAARIAKTMWENVDTRKWICVEADTKLAGSAGDLAFFFMVSSEFEDIVTTESMAAAIRQVCGGLTLVG